MFSTQLDDVSEFDTSLSIFSLSFKYTHSKKCDLGLFFL